MKRIKKIFAFLPAFALSAALTFGAGAQGVVDDVIDGAESIVDDTVDTAEDVVDGAGDIISGDDSIVGTSEDGDIPDQVQDDAAIPEAGKDESDVSGTDTPSAQDANPNTGVGIPFMTAGLVAVSAAGLAYLTRNREGFGNDRK